VDPAVVKAKAAMQAKAAKLLIPLTLSTMVGEKTLGGAGAVEYFQTMLAEAGNPTDPVEAILFQQLLLSHHRLGVLYARADLCQTPEHLKILNGTANRLLGELRRLALAIEVYRQPPSSRSFSVIAQQNVVASGTQLVQCADPVTATAEAATQGPSKPKDRGELEAPEATTGGYGGRLAGLDEESRKGRRRETTTAMG
jgi:hypothetical protein